jgi:hypothetical protein
MGIRVDFDRASIIQTITGIGKDANRAVFDHLKEEAREIRDLARQFAPVDDHDLEKAIKTQMVLSEKTVYIGIDPTIVDEHGKRVAEYGSMLHELLAIGAGGGTMKLGPKSRAKDGGRGVVGGGFLARAFEARKKSIVKNAAVKVKKITKS